MRKHLLFLLLLTIVTATLSGLGLLSADTARTATTEGRGQGEVNVLLGVQTDDEGRHVDDLLANTDVTLADQDTGVVDGLGETELVDAGLETTLQEILDLQGQHVIELHAALVKDTDTNETTNQGVAFEQTLGVLLVEGKKLTIGIVRGPSSFVPTMVCLRCQKLHTESGMRMGLDIPGSTTNLGEGELDTPDLTLVAETILANELQLGVPNRSMSVRGALST